MGNLDFLQFGLKNIFKRLLYDQSRAEKQIIKYLFIFNFKNTKSPPMHSLITFNIILLADATEKVKKIESQMLG